MDDLVENPKILPLGGKKPTEKFKRETGKASQG